MKNLNRFISFVMVLMLLLTLLSIGVLAQDNDQTGDDMMTGGEVQAWIQEVVDAPEDYVGQAVTLEGVVGDLVNFRSFTLMEDAELDVDGVLVVNNSGSPLDVNINDDGRFLVTGIVHAPIDDVYDDTADFDRTYYEDYMDDFRVEDENLALYEDSFDDYSSWPIVEVTNSGNIVPAVTIQELAGGAEPYDDNRVYAIEGYVTEIINDNLFVIGEGANIANAQILVFAPSSTDSDVNMGITEMGLDYDTVYDQDLFVRVYGTIAGVEDASINDRFTEWEDNTDLETDLDWDTVYEEEELGDYDVDAWEVVFANLVVQAREE